ncbi:MAG: molybdate ABC transporter substrate-binding protein [Armatimonadota bacterium]|nr:MAG: molybdate ABC transporter substrate-binding protein [Armatimonadota bacterium]
MSRGSQILIIVLLLAVLALGAAILIRGSQSARDPSHVLVYAPCGMTSPIGAAVGAFRRAHPDINLEVKYDNAVVLMREIRRGDRPDVFMSPGELEMRQLVEEGFVAGDTVRDFGTLDLVVFAPKTTPNLNTIQDLTKPHIKRIALAHPDYNSVGYYGKKALEALGLWDSLADKIFLREYPLEAVTMVTDGDVEAGITYLTCPLDTAPEKASKSSVRIVAALPRDAYPPVRCQVGLLQWSEGRSAVQTFAEFMLSDEAQQTISANGLLPIEETR